MTKISDENLALAFDFQRFEKSARLQKVIDAAHRRIEERELTDDELDWVAAAGSPESAEKPGKTRKPGDIRK